MHADMWRAAIDWGCMMPMLSDRKVTKREIIQLVTMARDRNLAYAESTKSNDNPQVVELSARAQAKHDAYDAVLLALRGDRVSLKIDAVGHIGVDPGPLSVPGVGPCPACADTLDGVLVDDGKGSVACGACGHVAWAY